MLFTRLTSWESACKIIVQRGKISPLYPLPPPSLGLSVFLPSLRNKSKTKLFPVHLTTVLEEVLSELKIYFHQYVQKIMLFLQKHSHFLKLQYLFRAHVINNEQSSSPTFSSLHLNHNSFSNPSIALPPSQLILQPFRCFTYVTVHSPTLLSLLLHHNPTFFSRATQLVAPFVGSNVWLMKEGCLTRFSRNEDGEMPASQFSHSWGGSIGPVRKMER